MGRGWWSDQWGMDGVLTNGEGVVVRQTGKGWRSDQWGRAGGFMTNGEGAAV